MSEVTKSESIKAFTKPVEVEVLPIFKSDGPGLPEYLVGYKLVGYKVDGQHLSVEEFAALYVFA